MLQRGLPPVLRCRGFAGRYVCERRHALLRALEPRRFVGGRGRTQAVRGVYERQPATGVGNVPWAKAQRGPARQARLAAAVAQLQWPGREHHLGGAPWRGSLLLSRRAETQTPVAKAAALANARPQAGPPQGRAARLAAAPDRARRSDTDRLLPLPADALRRARRCTRPCDRSCAHP